MTFCEWFLLQNFKIWNMTNNYCPFSNNVWSPFLKGVIKINPLVPSMTRCSSARLLSASCNQRNPSGFRPFAYNIGVKIKRSRTWGFEQQHQIMFSHLSKFWQLEPLDRPATQSTSILELLEYFMGSQKETKTQMGIERPGVKTWRIPLMTEQKLIWFVSCDKLSRISKSSVQSLSPPSRRPVFRLCYVSQGGGWNPNVAPNPRKAAQGWNDETLAEAFIALNSAGWHTLQL